MRQLSRSQSSSRAWTERHPEPRASIGPPGRRVSTHRSWRTNRSQSCSGWGARRATTTAPEDHAPCGSGQAGGLHAILGRKKPGRRPAARRQRARAFRCWLGNAATLNGWLEKSGARHHHLPAPHTHQERGLGFWRPPGRTTPTSWAHAGPAEIPCAGASRLTTRAATGCHNDIYVVAAPILEHSGRLAGGPLLEQTEGPGGEAARRCGSEIRTP
jgi:hypothetical protein